MRTVIMLVALLSVACVATAADWSFTDQVYSCTMSGMTFQELANAGVTYVSHVPATRETAEQAHRWGVRIMPYVSLYKVIDSSEAPGFKTQPFWKEIDLVEHPNWALIREDGQRRRPFDNPNYPVGLYQSCCNQPGIAEAYVRGVESVLAVGADGVFVDNVHPYPKCYGPELGLHRHLYPDKSNTEMYKVALRKVYQAVKAHGPEFAVMLNSGGPKHDYIGYGDSLMWESFIFRHGFVGDEGDLSVLRRYHDWPAVVRAYEGWKDFTDDGGSIAPLVYLPVREREKAHAFLSYACAKLCGFQQWTATARERQDILRQLYRTDTGKPVGPLEREGPLYYRRYERALVVGNSGTEKARADLPWQLNDPHVADLYAGETRLARGGKLRVELPPDSGRVYVTRSAYLANCLGEATGMAQSCALRLEKLAAEGGVPAEQAAAGKRVFDRAYERARACWKAAKQDGLPRDTGGRRRIAALAGALAPLEKLSRREGPEERLLKGEGLKAEDLPAVFRSQADLPFEVEIGGGSARLRSGGAVFSFGTGKSRASFRLGQSGMTLWASPGGLKGDHGWLHARRLEDIRLTRDEPNRKTVQFVVKLYGSKSQEDISQADVLVTATIRRGLPAVELQTALRNHADQPADSYWFWNIGARWHSLPDGRATKPDKWGSPGDVAWDYLHADETGGGGLVVTQHTGLGYGAGQADLFASPKNQTIPPQGEMPINWTAYVVWGSWQRDGFLQQRMRWYRQYASLAAQVASGLQVRLEAPSQLVAGVRSTIGVSLHGRQAPEAKGVELGLRALADGRELAVVPLAQTRRTERQFALELPAGLGEGRGVDLWAGAAVTGGEVPVDLAAFRRLRVRPGVEVSDLRQAPVAGGGLGFAATLRNNLPQALQAEIGLTGDGLPGDLRQTATLGADGDTVVKLAARGAKIPTASDKLRVKLAVRYQLPEGKPLSVESEREIALLPQAVCQTAASPPKLDGKLDDSCWPFATKLTNFVHHQTGEPAREQTVCYVVADDANLYVAFECQEADMKHLRAQAKPDEHGLNPQVPRDDSVEVYIDPRLAGKKYFRLALNSLGAAKSSAAGGWEAATAIEEDRWVVEVRIPFELIGAKPRSGAVWGFNACRNDQGSGEATAWSCTLGAYAKPERFGGLLFGG